MRVIYRAGKQPEITYYRSSRVAHAKIYVSPVNGNLTMNGQIFAFYTYFEKLSHRSQSFAQRICRPSFCNSTTRSLIHLKVSHTVKINYIHEVLLSG